MKQKHSQISFTEYFYTLQALHSLNHALYVKALLYLFCVLCPISIPNKVYCNDAQKHSWSGVLKEMNRSDAKGWLDQQNKPLYQIYRYVLKPSPIEKIFEQLSHFEMNISKPSIDSTLPEFRKKHHYGKKPFDYNRVLKEVEGFYYSGSVVVTPYHTYHIVQNPTYETVDDFWQLILTSGSPTIVTLVMPEKNTIVEYYSNQSLKKTYQGWALRLLSSETVSESARKQGHKITVRKFNAVNRKIKQSRVITQIHYENWPDGKGPACEMLSVLIDTVEQHHQSYSSPITVHCRAGQGRSGTFVAAQTVRKMIRNEKRKGKSKDTIFINIPKILYCLKLQRIGLVGGYLQTKAVYKIAANEYN